MRRTARFSAAIALLSLAFTSGVLATAGPADAFVNGPVRPVTNVATLGPHRYQVTVAMTNTSRHPVTLIRVEAGAIDSFVSGHASVQGYFNCWRHSRHGAVCAARLGGAPLLPGQTSGPVVFDVLTHGSGTRLDFTLSTYNIYSATPPPPWGAQFGFSCAWANLKCRGIWRTSV